MKPELILDIIAVSISVISVLAAAIACYFSFKATTPSIFIEINHNQCVYSEKFKKLIVPINLYNTSSIAGTIAHIRLQKDGDSKHYRPKIKGEIIDIQELKFIKKDSNHELLTDDLILETPIIVPPYGYKTGVLVFSEFLSANENVPSQIKCEIGFHIVGKRQLKCFKFNATLVAPSSVQVDSTKTLQIKDTSINSSKNLSA